MRSLLAVLVFAVALQTLFIVRAQAATTTIAYYRLGEDDAGSGNNQKGKNSTAGRTDSGVDSSLSLSRVGQPVYTTSLSSVAIARTGTTVGMVFDGTDGYTKSTTLTGATNNFGLEAFVKWNSGTGVIAANGDSASSGYSLIVANVGGAPHFEATFGGVATFDTGVAADTNWHDLAIIRTSGVMKLYLDGIQVGSTSTAGPVVPASGFGIGRNASGTQSFNGSVDEVRLFSFTAGTFVTTDLLVNTPVPEPSSLGFLAAGLVMLRRQK